MLFYAATVRADNRSRANLVEAIGIGYSGCKSREGAKTTRKYIATLKS